MNAAIEPQQGPPKGHVTSIIIAIIGAISAIIVAFVGAPPAARRAVEESVRTETKQELARQLPVGTIVASVLSPEMFSLKTGDGRSLGPRSTWVPCDLSDVRDSEYQKTMGEKTVPDLRGVFLRGLNRFVGHEIRKDEFRDESDPDGSRAPGSLRNDALGVGLRGMALNQLRELNYDGGGGRHEYGFYADAPDNSNVRVGNETVPRNAAVYFYCKIN